MKTVTSLSFALLVLACTCAAQTPPSKPLITISVTNDPPPAGSIVLAMTAVAREGAGATLAASATGSAPLTFQWFLNGEALAGATNSTYAATVLERADEGSYTVTVTNAFGQTNSDPTRLLISNVKPSSYVSLFVNAPTGGVMQIQRADTLNSNAVWQPLAGVTSSVSPLVIVDPDSTTTSQRFYKTPAGQRITARLLPGWSYQDATGSVHTIEYLEPRTGSNTWRTLQVLALSNTPFLFVDASATNGLDRRYRTTLRESAGTRRVGQVVFTTKWTLPADVYDAVTATNQAALAALGIFLNPAEHALQTATNPLAGYWVAVGDQRVMTSTNGSFQVDVPFGTTNGFVIRRAGDRTTPAYAIFNVNQLVPPGQAATPVLVTFVQDGVLHMNTACACGAPSLSPPPGGPDCGDPCAAVGNSRACCLDYNGLFNDGCRYPDDNPSSFASKVIRYLGSTCHTLVKAGLCANEGNALQFINGPLGVPLPYKPLTGPSCFSNHKYRNCQHVVRDDLSIAASAPAVACGNNINLTIHNNSWANETEIQLGPPSVKYVGALAGQYVVPGSSPGRYTLRHYDDAMPRASGGVGMHLEDQIIQYTAPSSQEMSANGGDQRIQVKVRAGDAERVLEIIVACCGPVLNPTVIPVPNMVYISPGTFTMGSPAGEPARSSDEVQHTVTLTCGFYMGKYAVTLSDYLAVMGSNPSYFIGDSSRPVETVSWNDAVAYCAALTAREQSAGRLPTGYVYRLPTEAEWEYACRAGTSTPFHYGFELRSGMGNFYGPYEYPPCGSSTYYCYNAGGTWEGLTTSVGSYAPNAWGLYDMHGNVWEWCQDWYGAYPGGSVTDPQGPSSGSYRVLHGGDWANAAIYCRSAQRGRRDPATGADNIGFRVVLAPGQ